MATTARMPAIWKHPRTHGYYLRRHIPPELRRILGWERRLSLRTKDAKVAKQRYPAASAQVDREVLEARQRLAEERRDVDLDTLSDAYEDSLTTAWREWDYAVRKATRRSIPSPRSRGRSSGSRSVRHGWPSCWASRG
jgi:hypothetical protein